MIGDLEHCRVVKQMAKQLPTGESPIGDEDFPHKVVVFLVVVGFLLAGAPVLAHTDSPSEILDHAIQEYRSALDSNDRAERLQRFRRAEMLFTRLTQADSPGRNAELYTNLGNAALQAERIGHAIVAYRRALTLDPDHRRARQNLEHARRLLPSWLPHPEERGLWGTFLGWSDALSGTERGTLAAVMYLIGIAFLAQSIRGRKTLFRNLAVLPLTVWLVLVGTLVFNRTDSHPTEAVITVPETIARAADSNRAPVRFRQPLPAGAEVRMLESREQWSHIQLADGRDAWIQSSGLESVNDF